MTVIEYIKDKVLRANREYLEHSPERFDFWEQHIRLVVREALALADEYGADREIVELGALLHDMALLSRVGTRQDHHINGAAIADRLLTEYGYPDDRKKRVLGCVLHHRSSQNAENIEELCVGDADILSHFHNIPMCFNSAFRSSRISTGSVDEWISYFEQEWNDLSERTKVKFRQRYENIMDVLFGALKEDWQSRA
ncbi:MAG: HD domain-containing protein [Bacillota bacterium]|nr:HD domain-containing protein [Bacillota bacterium]